MGVHAFDQCCGPSCPAFGLLSLTLLFEYLNLPGVVSGGISQESSQLLLHNFLTVWNISVFICVFWGIPFCRNACETSPETWQHASLWYTTRATWRRNMLSLVSALFLIKAWSKHIELFEWSNHMVWYAHVEQAPGAPSWCSTRVFNLSEVCFSIDIIPQMHEMVSHRSSQAGTVTEIDVFC